MVLSCQFNHEYLLTPWCRFLLEKLTGLQLDKKFSAFHGTRRFITALTSFHHLSLSWVNPIQSTYPHPTSWRSILILSTHLSLGLPSGLFPSGFPTKTLYAPLSSPIRATCPARLIMNSLVKFIWFSVMKYEVVSFKECNSDGFYINVVLCGTKRVIQASSCHRHGGKSRFFLVYPQIQRLHTEWLQCDDTKCCIIQFWPSHDEHTVLETCRGKQWTYYKTRICALSWLITKITLCLDSCSNRGKLSVNFEKSFTNFCTISLQIYRFRQHNFVTPLSNVW